RYRNCLTPRLSRLSITEGANAANNKSSNANFHHITGPPGSGTLDVMAGTNLLLCQKTYDLVGPWSNSEADSMTTAASAKSTTTCLRHLRCSYRSGASACCLPTPDLAPLRGRFLFGHMEPPFLIPWLERLFFKIRHCFFARRRLTAFGSGVTA